MANGALVPIREGQVLPAETPRKVEFAPTKRQRQYLIAVQEVLEGDGRLTDQAIATKLGVTAAAVWKMRQNVAFRNWLNAQIDAAVAEHWPKVLLRATRLALRGSIDHMNFLAKIGGRFQQQDAPPPGQGGPSFTFNVLIPRR